MNLQVLPIPTHDKFPFRKKSLRAGTFQNLNCSKVISSNSFPDILKFAHLHTVKCFLM